MLKPTDEQSQRNRSRTTTTKNNENENQETMRTNRMLITKDDKNELATAAATIDTKSNLQKQFQYHI